MRVARDVGVARGVHGDAVAVIMAAAAQVGRVDQPGAGRVQLGHEGVGTAGEGRWAAPAVVGKLVEFVKPVT